MYPFSEGVFAARNQWYVAAWSHEVDRSLLSRWILNEPVVFYRKENGDPVALYGKCPHRHFPLGDSYLVGDAVQCGYHGFTFNPEGQCIRIPTQDVIPDKCRIPAYPLVEKWQWLWIWMGDPEQADESLIPDHQALQLDDPNFLVEPGPYLDVDGRYQLLNDNLLDLSHLSFLHRTSIGSEEMAAAEEVREEGPNWLSSRRSARGIPCPPLFAALFDYEGEVERYFGMDFHMPGLHAGFDEFRKPVPGQDKGEMLGRLNVYHAVTPGRKHTTNYFFAAGRNFARSEEVSRQLMGGLEPVLHEDAYATKAIEQMINSIDAPPTEFLARGDAHAVRGRRILEALIRNEMAAS